MYFASAFYGAEGRTQSCAIQVGPRATEAGLGVHDLVDHMPQTPPQRHRHVAMRDMLQNAVRFQLDWCWGHQMSH